ncbi:MAG TPA: hypothetical protein VH063_09270 [Gaiellaceae bacterium]|nr:hypothetical protein [Gaiellaceae bacterium]
MLRGGQNLAYGHRSPVPAGCGKHIGRSAASMLLGIKGRPDSMGSRPVRRRV